MPDLSLLRDLVLLVGAAIPTVALASRLGVPSVVALLLIGVLIGPAGLGVIPHPESVQSLAEIGVVLLLFALGLEMSLAQVRQLGQLVFQAGALQVAATIAAVAVLLLLSGSPPARAVFYGSLVALSSTAVVTRLYSDAAEVDTPHGRLVIAVLLFQDLCVLPLMLLMPLFAGGTGVDLMSRGIEVAVGFVSLAALVAGGVVVIPWVLDRIVLLRDRELFTLCIAFFALGIALATSALGLSLALGAFVAGLLISHSEYGLQALSDVIPFRALFSGIFFISIGMLLDLELLVRQPLLVAGVTGGILVLKAVVAAAVGLTVRRAPGTSLTSGLSLAQVGEFSFVLAAVGRPLGLFGEGGFQLFMSAAVLTLLATPYLIRVARPLSEALARTTGGIAQGEGPSLDRFTATDHAIIVGFGLAGRYLAQVFRAAGIPFIVIEQNGQLVRQARDDGVPVVFGDGTRGDMLRAVGIRRARVVVFVISSPVDERRGIAAAREANPQVRILVRTRYIRAIEDLTQLGASEVVVEEFEASLELFARVLESYEIPSNRIWREVDAVRREHYAALRGEPPADLKLDRLKHLGIHTALELIEVEEGSRAVGESATSLDLRRGTGAIQVAVVRDGRAFYERDPAFRYQVGDTTVLVGDGEALERAAALFRRQA